jgi:hypothetical protein
MNTNQLEHRRVERFEGGNKPEKIGSPFFYTLFECKLSILCFEFCPVRREGRFSNTKFREIKRGRTICSQNLNRWMGPATHSPLQNTQLERAIQNL